MVIKNIIEEDFINYCKPSMFIAFPYCTFKCEKDCGIQCCQNNKLVLSQNIDINIDVVVKHYVDNHITKAVVCGGLEPFDSFDDLYNFISALRAASQDDVVIYTGYYEHEIVSQIEILKSSFSNIIVKFGRFIPNLEGIYDATIGVMLASKNQYAKKIS
jgi:hypothetical protein